MVINPNIWDIIPGIRYLNWSTNITSLGISGSLASSKLFLELCLHGILTILTYRHDYQTGISHFESLLGSIHCSAIICSLRNEQCPNLWWSFNSSEGRLVFPLSSSFTTILSCLIGVVSLNLFSLNWVGYPGSLEAHSLSACPSTSLSLSLTSAAACSEIKGSESVSVPS